jgi:hypothetical protein
MDLIINNLGIDLPLGTMDSKSQKEDYFYYLYGYNSSLMMPKKWIEQYITLFEMMINYGFKTNKKILLINYRDESIYDKAMNPLELYMSGCNPVKVMYPELHNRIIELLTPDSEIEI